MISSGTNAGAGMYRTKAMNGSQSACTLLKVPIARPSGIEIASESANPIITRRTLIQASCTSSPDVRSSRPASQICGRLGVNNESVSVDSRIQRTSGLTIDAVIRAARIRGGRSSRMRQNWAGRRPTPSRPPGLPARGRLV